MEIDQFLYDLLHKRNRDYLTVRSVRDALSSRQLKQLDLVKGKSSVAMVIDKLRPYFKETFREFVGPRTVYIGFNLSIEELIIRKLAKNGALSSKQLRNQLPIKNREFILEINRLLSSARITCTLNEKSHLPVSFRVSDPAKLQEVVSGENDALLFENALKKIGKGSHFVRIHEIRDYLNWPRSRFNSVLERLKAELAIQLQGGDPSLLTEAELKHSYVDEKGRVRITVTWIK